MLRQLILEVEALWWLSRTYTNTIPLLLASMAWLSTDSQSGDAEHLALLVGIASIGAAGMTLNDIRDLNGDRTTAPFMPVASGMISIKRAKAAVVGFVVLGLIAFKWTSPSTPRQLIASAALVSCVLSAIPYSRLKPSGLFASLFIALPYMIATLIGAVLSGGYATVDTYIIVAIAGLYGLHSNIGTALYDSQLDGTIGNRTLPVRIGDRASINWICSIAALDWGLALAVILRQEVAVVPLFLLVAALGVAVWRFPLLQRRLADRLSRLDRIDVLAPLLWAALLTHAAIVAAFTPLLGLAYAVIALFANALGERLFRRRVVTGALAAQLGADGPA